MMPFDLLSNAVTGTRIEWIVLASLLPFVGRAVAQSWGAPGVIGAQRALLLVTLDLAYSLLMAWPVHAGALLVAALPILGAALSRTRPTLMADWRGWLAAAAFTLPALLANHLSASELAVAWLILLPSVAMAWAFANSITPALREWAAPWRLEDVEDTHADAEPILK
jgi:hypothetical protein